MDLWLELGWNGLLAALGRKGLDAVGIGRQDMVRVWVRVDGRVRESLRTCRARFKAYLGITLMV